MKTKFIFTLVLTLLMIGCSDNPHLRTGDDAEIDPISEGTTTIDPFAPVTCGTGNAGNGATCDGSTLDGNSCGQVPIGNYRVVLAGLQSWYPQKIQVSSIHKELKLSYVLKVMED